MSKHFLERATGDVASFKTTFTQFDTHIILMLTM
jgi:hypothetical protein